MTEWISVEDRLPEKKKAFYWIYDQGMVYKALYTDECWDMKDGGLVGHKWGFSIEQLEAYDHAIETVTHWMPYYTPEPPTK